MPGKGTVRIDAENCKGCLLCVRACALKVLEKADAPAASGTYPARVKEGAACAACLACYEVCPDSCIQVYKNADGKAAGAQGKEGAA